MSHIPFHRFETLQLHAGQETADPAPDARAVLFIRPHPMSFTTPPTRRLGSIWRNQATSTAD